MTVASYPGVWGGGGVCVNNGRSRASTLIFVLLCELVFI